MTIRLWMLAAILICGQMKALAQIPAEVIDVLKKCDEKMSNPAGLEIDGTIKAKMFIFSMNGTLKSYMKGDKSKDIMRVKAMGFEEYEESGFDGTQEWTYKKPAKEKERDSLIIKKADKRAKSESNLDMDIYKEYNKAKMKISGRYYVITLTNPKTKDSPKKTILKIDKETFYAREMYAKEGGGSMTVTITKIKVGVNDNVFILDPKKYPKAVVVRK